ncbi:SDR family oxidoreductase [Microbaculum marinum]|uniref:SDR family oxidoreductase n=1 Tax=Microbaculum marinum TaxID=1764581 RepID=A0AAW9RPQ4_9HYPH
MSKLFIFGLGFSALTLSRRLMAQGWQVAGTVRTPEKAAALRAEGVGAVVFDGREAGRDVPAALAGADHVAVSIPPGEAGDPVLLHHRADLAEWTGAIRWLGYLSTLGVYGDHGGDWIDEETVPDPVSPRNARRVAAEHDWRRFGEETGIPVMIFRIAGIYGPGRNALAKVASGEARRLVKPGQVFNRIHVADIAGVLEASMRRPRAGGVYNVCDDEPAPPQDVIAYAAELLGVEPPPEVPFDEAELSPMARTFYSANRRARNDRIRQELGVRLEYPDYRRGLNALFAAGEGR